MEKKAAPQILREGAGHVREGWTQHGFSLYGAVCAMGGMRMASSGDANLRGILNGEEYNRAERALAQVMAEQFSIDTVGHRPQPDRGLHTINWVEFELDPFDIIATGNDARGRTAEEVATCMEKAAVDLGG